MNQLRGMGTGMTMRFISIFLAGTLVGAVSAIEVVPNFNGSATDPGVLSQGTVEDPSVGSAGSLGGLPADQGTGTVPGPAALPTSVQSAGRGLTCDAAGNGGDLEIPGVTANEIKLATTVVESGIGAAFLRDVRFAMEAVREEVNRAGGICGRMLTIDYIDDGWDPQRGAGYIANFAKEVFALPVGPSSEGLRIAINNGTIDKAQLPVVGTDGMLIDQYVNAKGLAQPLVWSVATATVASARIMARNAWDSGARSFGIVFDKNYRFGWEAARAFNSEVKRLKKTEGVEGFNEESNCSERYCGILAGQSSYSNQVIEYYRQRVDFTALFLEPTTALTWMADPNTPPATEVRYGAAQPLFTREFAVNCQFKCHKMTVWTGFKPPIERYKSDPAVQKYVSDLRRTSPQADEFNAFVIGGYIGMRLLVDALKRIGPNLSKEALKVALDTTQLQTGLTLQPKLSWRPDWRWVNTTMQGFTINYPGTFAGWREGPIQQDPCPDCGIN